MTCSLPVVLGTGCLLALALAPLPAAGADASRIHWHAASAVCGTNNPELEAGVRRRVNEFANVGAEAIAVTCGAMSETAVSDGDFTEVVVYLQNNLASTASVSCTLNAGTSQDTLYTSKKTVSVAAGAVGNLSWAPGDYGVLRKHATLSCTLPAGWSIRDLAISFNEFVGT